MMFYHALQKSQYNVLYISENGELLKQNGIVG